MSDYLLAIDQGTSSSRAIVFDTRGEIAALRQRELKLYYPHDGWVEQDPKDILEDTVWAIESVLQDMKRKASSVRAAGITNQRETTILWSKKTGEPVYNAIVWQDRRTAELCRDLRQTGIEEIITQKTGLLLDPYFSALKIQWILDNVAGVRERAERGEIAFGTVDSFLLWHLTSGAIHATDATNASRTMLYNIHDQEWDDEILDIFGIPPEILPDVLDNIADYGQINHPDISADLVIGGVAGDQQSALIGQGCLSAGMIKATYGTGCFALINTGSVVPESQSRLLATIGYRLDGRVTYALEGAIFNAGTVIQYLRDNLKFFTDASESEALALRVSGSDGVYFVPAFTGLGAPHWEPDARGIICGLTRDKTDAHITRAALEAQGYQSRDLIQAMQDDSGHTVSVVRADGGLVKNHFMCQFIADQIQRQVELPKVTECTAWGAACLAGVYAGVFGSLEEVANQWRMDQTYVPQMEKTEADRLYAGWQEAVRKSMKAD